MKCLLLTLGLLPFLSGHAQSHFQPGKIVLNTGDTLTGQVDYGNWRVNPRAIRFRRDGGDVVRYTVADVGYIEITGQDAYRRGVVDKDMRPLSYSDPALNVLDSTVRDTAWLRVLVTGSAVSLYELYDGKEHFFISRATGRYEELKYKRFFVDNATQMEEVNGFRDQLAALAPSSLRGRIDKTRYNDGDLTAVVLAIDGQGAVTGAAHNRGAVHFRFFAAVGIVSSNLTLSGPTGNSAYAPVDGIKSSRVYSPTGSIGLDIVRIRNHGDLALRGELGYWQAAYTGSITDQYGNVVTAKVSAHMISPAITAIWFFYRGAIVRCYAGVGVAANITSYPDNYYTENGPTTGYFKASPAADMNKTWYQPTLRLGAQFFDHFTVEASGAPACQITNDSYHKGDVQVLALRIGYHFMGAR